MKAEPTFFPSSNSNEDAYFRLLSGNSLSHKKNIDLPFGHRKDK
jgi:hypothetical protein